MGTEKAGSTKRSKKLRLESKHGLWKTDEAKMVSASDPDQKRTLVLWGISNTSFSADQSTRIIERIKSITQREFPGVAPVSKVGASSKEIVIYVAGTVGRTIRQEIAPRETLINKLSTFAEKLDQLHEQGIVHGDLRPETLLIQEDGELAAAHFAVHHAIHDWSPNGRTLDSANFGKYSPSTYYAPELRHGENAAAASDQYSLACIVLEVLLGRPLDSMEAPLDAVNKVQSNGDLRSSLKKALAETPEERFSTCSEFLTSITKSVEQASVQRKKKIPWKLVAAILVAPLVLAPTAKWVLAQSEQSRLDEEELTELREKYEIEVPPPKERLISGLASNTNAKTVYEKWFDQHVARRDSLTQQQMQSMLASWISQWNLRQLVVDMSLSKASTNERRVFMFNDQGNIRSEGEPEGALMIKVSNLPNSSADFPDAKARLTVEVNRTAVKQHELSLSSARTFDIQIEPANREWSVGTELSMTLEVRPDESTGWRMISNQSLPSLKFGVVEWKEVLPTYLSVTRAVDTKCMQSTSVSVKQGDKFRVEVTGSVQVFTPEILKKHKLPDKLDIGPSGATAELTEGRGYEYVTLLRGSQNWGAAIMKIGSSGQWFVPSTKSQPLIASATGPIYLGINSVDHRRLKVTGKRTELFGDEDYWHRQGSFTVKISHQQVELPPNTSSTVRSKLIGALK